jgi:hypothetical protein
MPLLHIGKVLEVKVLLGRLLISGGEHEANLWPFVELQNGGLTGNPENGASYCQLLPT